MGSTDLLRIWKETDSSAFSSTKKAQQPKPTRIYPIPKMSKCIGSFSEATVFSNPDASSGSLQLEIEDEYQDTT